MVCVSNDQPTDYVKNISRVLIITFISCISCKQNVTIEGLDKDNWKADKNGCNGTRMDMKPVLESNLEKIKGLDQEEIQELLGKPDKNELYKRSQKFFVYYLSPAPSCTPGHTSEQQEIYLSIRFNATGLAKEVLVYYN